jgi:hypothetical protein
MGPIVPVDEKDVLEDLAAKNCSLGDQPSKDGGIDRCVRLSAAVTPTPAAEVCGLDRVSGWALFDRFPQLQPATLTTEPSWSLRTCA